MITSKLDCSGLKAAIQEFTSSIASVTLCNNEGTGLLLQPVVHYSMMNIITALFEALSSNELVYNITSYVIICDSESDMIVIEI